MEKYLFRPHDPSINEWFIEERQKLFELLGSSVQIEHIGSTAVTGLGGKGILDIMVGKCDVPLDQLIKLTKSLGYEYVPSAGSPERKFFFRDALYNNQENRIHLHFVNTTSEELNNALLFRDFLNSNEEAKITYANIKKNAAEAAEGDGKIYREYKESCIIQILAQAKKIIMSRILHACTSIKK